VVVSRLLASFHRQVETGGLQWSSLASSHRFTVKSRREDSSGRLSPPRIVSPSSPDGRCASHSLPVLASNVDLSYALQPG
jgi:hypothetical protein